LHTIGDKRQTNSRQADFLGVTFKETSTLHREDCGQKDEGVIRTSEECPQNVTTGVLNEVGSVGMCDTRVEKVQASLNAEPAGGVGVLTHGAMGSGEERDKRVPRQVLTETVVDSLERLGTIGPERGLGSFSPDCESHGPTQNVCIGGPGGVFIDKGLGKKLVVVSSLSESKELSLEGVVTSPFPYVQKEKGKKKTNHQQQSSQLGVPKCIQLVEVVQQGRMGVRKKKGSKGSEFDQARKGDSNGVNNGSEAEGEIGGGNAGSINETLTSQVNVPDGGNAGSLKETIFPQVNVPGRFDSGVSLLQRDDNSHNSDEDGSVKSGHNLLQKEASKLLEIQKAVGFSFELEDREVCDRMVEDELHDRVQKVGREQTIGDQ
jgi:hypothetical protein